MRYKRMKEAKLCNFYNEYLVIQKNIFTFATQIIRNDYDR